MQAAGFAKAHRPTQHGGSGQLRLARSKNDGFVKRLVLPAVTFAKKNAEEDGVGGDLHKFNFSHR